MRRRMMTTTSRMAKTEARVAKFEKIRNSDKLPV